MNHGGDRDRAEALWKMHRSPDKAKGLAARARRCSVDSIIPSALRIRVCGSGRKKETVSAGL